MSPIFLVVTRGICALYCIILMIFGIRNNVSPPKWLTYMTSWNYMFVTLYFMLAFALSLTQSVLDYRSESAYKNDESVQLRSTQPGNPLHSDQSIANNACFEPPEDVNSKEKSVTNEKLPWKLKLFWIIFTFTINLCTAVFILYWAFHKEKQRIELTLSFYTTVDRHGINLILIVIDFVLHKVPYRILHFIYPAITIIVYVIFNVTYWSISGDKVYSLAKWETPGFMIGCTVGVIALIFVLQCIWYGCHNRKRYFAVIIEKANDGDMSIY